MAKFLELVNSTVTNSQTVTRYHSIWRDMIRGDGIIKLQTASPYDGMRVTEQPIPDKSVLVNIDGTGFGSAVVRKTSPIIVAGPLAKPFDIKKDLWKVLINTDQTVAISDNVSGLDRIDIIICRIDETLPGSAGETSIFFEAIDGIPNASPVAPSKPDDSIILANVFVANGFTAINDADITDSRDFVSLPSDVVASPDIALESLFWSGIIQDDDKLNLGDEFRAIAQIPPTQSVDILNGTGDARAFFGLDKSTVQTTVEKTAITNVVISPSNPTDPRFTLVYLENNGVFGTFDGVAAPIPDLVLPANFWTDKLPICMIYIPQSSVSIQQANIEDMRYTRGSKAKRHGKNLVPNSTFAVIEGTFDGGVVDVWPWRVRNDGVLTFVEDVITTDAVDREAYKLIVTDASGANGNFRRTLQLDNNDIHGDEITMSIWYKRGLAIHANIYPFAGITYLFQGNRYEVNILDNSESHNLNQQGGALSVNNTDWLRASKQYKVPDGATDVRCEYGFTSTNVIVSQDYQIFFDQFQIEIGNELSVWSQGGNDALNEIFNFPTTFSRGPGNAATFNYLVGGDITTGRVNGFDIEWEIQADMRGNRTTLFGGALGYAQLDFQFKGASSSPQTGNANGQWNSRLLMRSTGLTGGVSEDIKVVGRIGNEGGDATNVSFPRLGGAVGGSQSVSVNARYKDLKRINTRFLIQRTLFTGFAGPAGNSFIRNVIISAKFNRL